MTIYYTHKNNLIPADQVDEWRKSDPDTVALVTVQEHEERVKELSAKFE